MEVFWKQGQGGADTWNSTCPWGQRLLEVRLPKTARTGNSQGGDAIHSLCWLHILCKRQTNGRTRAPRRFTKQGVSCQPCRSESSEGSRALDLGAEVHWKDYIKAQGSLTNQPQQTNWLLKWELRIEIKEKLKSTRWGNGETGVCKVQNHIIRLPEMRTHGELRSTLNLGLN